MVLSVVAVQFARMYWPAGTVSVQSTHGQYAVLPQRLVPDKYCVGRHEAMAGHGCQTLL